MKLNFYLTPSILAALVAATLFGSSMPLAKYLIGNLSPLLLAGLLYLGSGVGLLAIRFLRDRGWRQVSLSYSEWLWLIGAIGIGGIVGPSLLMWGLTQTSAATASLLINLETVLTAVLAYVVFKEHVDRSILLGMVFIVVGGIILSWPHGQVIQQTWWGSLAIAGACLCWAIDNNLTRKVSACDSLFIAGNKGLIAGIVNTSLALILGQSLPTWSSISLAMLLGFFGYGISLALFVLALRGLGTARTGAYFSVAPFIGAAFAIFFFHETTSMLFWVALIFMAIGVGLHLAERHEHEHTHEPLIHVHLHNHDEHHQHEHDFAWDGTEPHTHPHQHQPITHFHVHFPDIHHLHRHR